jgi:hypothetical protein
MQCIIIRNVDMNIENIQQAGRPALQDEATDIQAEPGERHGHHQAVADMQCEARGAEQGDQIAYQNIS